MNLWTSRDISNAAYVSILPVVGSIKRRIIEHVYLTPSTDDEIESALGVSHQTVSAARRTLVKNGLIERTGTLRATRSGRQAQVWQASEVSEKKLTRKV